MSWVENLVGCLIVVLLVLVTAALVMVMGYGLGFWSVSCAMDSSQPACIAHGWNGGTVTVR